ncbi:T9SS type A sorting domain-containing protein [Chryseobacterium chendengshani]|uniref:T9SS type A sorting domain-containing protein n=1 Tax=Chryseobacterium sp. LJ668 TaxID=2864040 RepID=UPI001C69230F|nr:M64 family metallopeptidase [Chryseobacterium sp. LJ668]MBW8524680.1 T9SS type A sorting domain-containing protein [Chryseobacterium sp. LJ668]QYK15078.1 T9SS type A sorting domain-containing protein [Chryseobacterium sp. LJ668]
MKKHLLILLLSSSFCFSQTFDTVPLLQNGTNDKRINIAVLGDGFTVAQLPAFVTSAQNTVNYLFTKSPYTEYKNYFNVYAVKVISAESGVKHPGTATDVTEPVIPVSNPNNYLGSTFDIGVHRCIYSNTTNKVAQVLSANVPDYDITYVLGNSTEYGGCGGAYAFASLNSSANEIVVHELGHSFGNLADEYWFAGSGESANKTQTSNPATIKWKNWVGLNSVGVFPHAESPSWFRPHQSCEMRYLNQQFCSVCKERIIEKIHSLVSPVDSFTPVNTSTVDANSNVTFTVNEILPIPNTLVNTWKLNGTTLAATGNTLTVTPSQLNNGNNTLLFSVTDNTTLVKTDNHSTVHFTNVSWTLNKNALGTSEIKAEERRFSIYPNPANTEFFIRGRSNFAKDIKITLYDASGKLVPVKFELQDAATVYVDIHDLPSGIYTVTATEGKSLIISQKIIKE